jgi:hypothetical protein
MVFQLTIGTGFILSYPNESNLTPGLRLHYGPLDAVDRADLEIVLLRKWTCPDVGALVVGDTLRRSEGPSQGIPRHESFVFIGAIASAAS